MRSIQFSFLWAAVILGQASAEVSFNSTLADSDFDGTVPANTISEKCGAAYAATVKCSDLLFRLRDSEMGPEYFTQKDLGDFCSTDCIDSLNNWDKKIQEDCTDEDKLAVEDPTGSVLYLSMVLEDRHSIQENLYWTFCLKDSETGTYCLADDNLPEWPTAETDEAVTTTFCRNSCRTQQSYLMHRSAAHSGYSSVDLANAEQTCPNLDTSTFAVNVKMLEAFGTNADPPTSENAVDENSEEGEIEGTEYDWDMYLQDFDTEVADDGNPAGSPDGTPDDENSGLRTGFSTGFLFISAALVIVGELLS